VFSDRGWPSSPIASARRPALISERETLQLPHAGRNGPTVYGAAGRGQQDLAKGETVCLVMPNRPEYMAAWLGNHQRRRVSLR